ncbi:Chemotaxis response regulator protein-glutamate methylesterase CheB, partial [hydrothermal vent metagenome]
HRADNARQVRVMLVEDSAVIRGMVRSWLDGVDNVEVVASADNGQIALNTVAAARPDIIILDIEMPVMDGLTALPGLLAACPGVKVLIASTLSKRNAEISMKAINMGAADYLAKPSFARDGNEARRMFKEELVRKVVGLGQNGGGGHHGVVHTPAPANDAGANRAAAATSGWTTIPSGSSDFKLRPASRVRPRILVIGSSTGGPAALSKVLGALKGRLSGVPVVITQHMPPTFTTLLGETLSRLSGLEGGETHDGETVSAGRIYVAPGGFHMRLIQLGSQIKIALNDGPPINHCRPAVDPLFESVAQIYRGAALGVVLTGMGSDGALGAVKIADAGGSVLAQDEASSIVWGMPGAAMAAGACVAAVELENLGDRIGLMLGLGSGRNKIKT